MTEAAARGHAVPLDARSLVGEADILWITLDTLRYDVAQGCHERGQTPFLSSLLPAAGWERRSRSPVPPSTRSARVHELPAERRLFTFRHVSALHQPNCTYVEGATRDACTTQAAALQYVDGCLAPLLNAIR